MKWDKAYNNNNIRVNMQRLKGKFVFENIFNKSKNRHVSKLKDNKNNNNKINQSNRLLQSRNINNNNRGETLKAYKSHIHAVRILLSAIYL